MKIISFLLFGDSPWMKASISIFFISTSNVPSQLIAVKCCPSRKYLPLHNLDGETPSFVNIGKFSCHKEVLIVLWGHTQLFRSVKFVVVAGVQAEPEGR
jgi:hypothetical protein